MSPDEVRRREELRRLFQERHPAPARTNDVISFDAWISHNRPDLLPAGRQQDDRYRLRPDLEGLYTE